jgi:hypothetical protein
MPELSQLTFNYQEVAKALIIEADIHEGLWGIYVEFGFGATNMEISPGVIAPSVVVPINKIGIQKFAEPNNLTVDAAEVNPVRKSKKPN